MIFLRDVFAVAFFLASYLSLTAAKTTCHNETFIPDAILRITEGNLAQSCYPSKATVLVNGTSPGPALTIKQGYTYWIRVYNDMPIKNLTMVNHSLDMECRQGIKAKPNTALAWSLHGHIPIQ